MIDSARIFIKSGKGGDGHVSFRRELFVAAGGPDGGDGGRGGDIIFEVDKGLNTLNDFRHVRKYIAQSGEDGKKRRSHGADGQDLIVKVPEGTIIRDDASGKIIADMSGKNMREVILKGGRGGAGNMHFATPTMQVPKFAKPGQPAMELWVRLELKVIADVGLVGYPNVGKSTILSMVTNAKPKIANYHFTTLDPYVGIVDLEGTNGFALADIPGLIEGASEGIGLGFQFLKHIQRTKALIHVVDAASTEGRDPIEDIRTIQNELASYDPELLKKPAVIAANKVDVIQTEDGDEDPIERLKNTFEPEGLKVFPVSAASNQGLKELLYHVWQILSTMDPEPTVYEKEYVPEYDLGSNLPYTVEKTDEHLFTVEGPRIEKMLGYTNLDSEKGFTFFQRFLKETGILKELEDLGIEDGDTVKMYGQHFDYYHE